jgi:hypothetical protein
MKWCDVIIFSFNVFYPLDILPLALVLLLLRFKRMSRRKEQVVLMRGYLFGLWSLTWASPVQAAVGMPETICPEAGAASPWLVPVI